MLRKLYRTFKAGVQNFFRNGWLSIATVSVIVITLFIINIQVAIVFANEMLLKDVEGRVNISVYVNLDVPEDEILNMKQVFESYSEVTEVEYISKDQALADFRERNKDNETIQQSIQELGSNPLGAVLNLKAQDPSQYETIASKIQQSTYAEKISKVNYQKYRGIIDNLNKEIKSNQRVAIALGATLSLIAVLITFNSIRITMYSHRQEIEIMKLVGASNNYIKFPFIWEGIFYGIAAAIVTIPLVYLYLKFIGADEMSESILPLSNTRFLRAYLSDYFLRNLLMVSAGQFLFGIFLGVISSMIAIRRHLKV